MFFSIKEDFSLDIAPEALTLKPVKAIFDSNKKNIEKTINELSYVYYMEDVQSIFQYLLDLDERKKDVLEILSLPDGWEESKEVLALRKFYAEMQKHDDVVALFVTARMCLKNMQKFLEELDLNERDKDSNKLIHNPSQIAGVFKTLRELALQLKDAEKDILSNSNSLNTKVGQSEKGLLEGITV